LVVDPNMRADENVLPVVRSALAERFDIHHITIQCEVKPCVQADNETDHFREPSRHTAPT
jgi:cobalt-zinc-cadmium efflux system protein